MTRWKIIKFIIRTLFTPYGMGSSVCKTDVSYNITDSNGDYVFVRYCEGNNLTEQGECPDGFEPVKLNIGDGGGGYQPKPVAYHSPTEQGDSNDKTSK